MTDIFTARIWYRGDDRLDITFDAKSPFAPLRDTLDQYRSERKRCLLCHDFDGMKKAWHRYQVDYIARIEREYRLHPELFKRSIFDKDRVVLVCYCPSPDICHRGLLADYLKDFENVTYRGEIEVADP
jgi:uncharacterized protein YeaO (DUF488 family)